MTTMVTVPSAAELPNRAHSNGQAMAEKMPASAAVTGVGVIVTMVADRRSQESGNDSTAQVCSSEQ